MAEINRRLLVAATITILLVGLATAAVFAATQPATAESADQCSVESTVTHDEFRTDSDTIDETNDSDDGAETINQNTRTTVEEGDAFARVGVENPNSYCVEFEIELSEEVVNPATLGQVEAVEEDIEATWQANHDFDADETYTLITVEVPAETDAQFAPSQLRVETLAWTGDAEREAESLREQLSERFGLDEDLEQRSYELDGDEGEILTLDLEHPETGEAIDNWHAIYQLQGEHAKPLDEGSGEPVFYRELEDEAGDTTGIQVTFNEPGVVEFTAEPTTRDRLEYETTSYRASLRDTVSWGPLR